ncbi:molybdopterin-dependent oxidoreductase [Luedemannella helvata]|uniref:molybdopterin-dependent oxidoreductase n=1 Tax=Luedemannella helvata TaxID=349315 RepID=UPI0031D5924C
MGRTKRDGAVAGVVAAGVAIGVAELVAVLTGPRTAPLVAVGGWVVDHVPEAGKELAIDLFGTYDKVALLIGTSVLLAAFAAGIGVLAVRRRYLGYAGIALFGAIGVGAALTRHDVGLLAALPSLVGALAGAATLGWVLGERGRVSVDSGAAEEEAVGRRRFLRGVGFAAVGALVAGVGGRMLSVRRSVTAARDAVVLPTAGDTGAVAPPQADLGVAHLTPYVTGNRSFYRIDTAITVPQVDPATWKLRIHGRVDNPMTLTWEQLLARPMIERYVTLACVSNPVGGDLIGNARWLGVPLKELLLEAAPQAGADQVVSRSVDGFTAGSPTAALLDGRDAMIAVGMNGVPLPIEHGFPARLVVPGLYGYVSATKWLAELELTSFADFDAYWIPRGWAREAPIKTQSRIDTPSAGREVAAGTVVVAGVAWAQRRGISTVEVRVNGGAWQKATLAATVSIDTWRQWRWEWQATPGRYELQVRATDNGGTPQVETRTPQVPDGATGYHTVRVTVA